MKSVKKIEKVYRGDMIIQIPPEFFGKNVKITIEEINNNDDEKSELQSHLLNAPILTENELNEIEKVHDRFDQWVGY